MYLQKSFKTHVGLFLRLPSKMHRAKYHVNTNKFPKKDGSASMNYIFSWEKGQFEFWLWPRPVMCKKVTWLLLHQLLSKFWSFKFNHPFVQFKKTKTFPFLQFCNFVNKPRCTCFGQQFFAGAGTGNHGNFGTFWTVSKRRAPRNSARESGQTCFPGFWTPGPWFDVVI